jgi:dTDP-4-amino-4,6-dideoxygalactose transaminase
MSGYIGQGPQVDEFERLLGDFIGNKRCVTLNSGTSALHLALHMIKDKEVAWGRDEVLTTPLTCTATNFPILANGLKIKWVDVNPHTCNVDLNDLRRKINKKTLAIMVVHWGGLPVNLTELKDIQDECETLYGFRPQIIEDCAHAMGSTFKGRRLGNHGNFCIYSFQAIKHLTTGDGGLLVCPTDEFYSRAKLLRWYGLDRTSSADFRCEQNIQEWGFKFHMNDIAATIGIHNIKHLPRIIANHQSNASYYRSALQGLDVTLMDALPDRVSADWIFTIRVQRRDDFIVAMKGRGIGVGRVHDRNDKHTCLKEFRVPLPGTDKTCKEMVCLPCGWWITPEDREYVVECIKEGW